MVDRSFISRVPIIRAREWYTRCTLEGIGPCDAELEQPCMKRVNLNNGLDLLTTRGAKSSLCEGKIVRPSLAIQLGTGIWQ
jgi:hypothetical protein